MSKFARPRAEGTEPDRWRAALEAALRVSEIVSSATAVPEAVQSVVRIAIDLLGAERSSIMLLDDVGHELVLVAAAGETPGVPLGHRVRVGEGVAGRVLATGQCLRIDGEVDRDAFINFAPKNPPIASSIVAPLRVNGRAIGVLSLATARSAPPFTDADKRLAQMLADQAAGLINRTKLHEQAERRSADLAALIEASKGLLGVLDLEALLQAILDGGSRLTSATQGFACLFDATTGALARGVFRAVDKALIRSITQLPATTSVIDEVGVSVVTHDTAGAFVAIGLRSSQGTKGLLVVRGEAALVEERGYLLRAFAQQCATALGTAELYAVVGRKESELGSIIQSVPNPIVLADSNGNIASLNPSAEQLFGTSSVFSIGAPVRGTLSNHEIEELLLGQGEVLTEVEIGTPARTFKVRTRDVRVPGAPMGRLLVMDDVTAEREMVQTQHDFVAMIGHELRTPLTIIKGFAKMLLKRADNVRPDETREAVRTIATKSGQLERLIEDLLYVSKIEAREARIRVEQVDVAATIQHTAAEVLADHPDREVDLDLPAELTWACDETKLALVIRHLVDNALKYSDAPAPVVIRATQDDDEVRVDVIDRGVGIVSSDIPHIFERFRQLDGSSTREHGGTGVGLYLCAQLMKVQGGRIWVDSAWGKGSTFSFTLPRRALRSDMVNLRGGSAPPRAATSGSSQPPQQDAPPPGASPAAGRS